MGVTVLMNEDRSVIQYKFYLFVVFSVILGFVAVIFGAYIANSRSIVEGIIVFIVSMFIIFLSLEYTFVNPFEKIIIDPYGITKKNGKGESFLSWEEMKLLDVKYDWKNRWRNNEYVYALIISNPADEKITINFSWAVRNDLRTKLIKHCERQDLIEKFEEILDKRNIEAVYKNRKIYKS